MVVLASRKLQTDRRGFLTALGEIRMPEKTGGDGAPWLPGCAHLLELFGRRALAKMLYLLHGGCESEIAHGPDVRAAQRAEQINVRSPSADALQGDQFFARMIVMQVVERLQIELAALDGIGEESRVVRLLAAEAEPAHLYLGEP